MDNINFIKETLPTLSIIVVILAVILAVLYFLYKKIQKNISGKLNSLQSQLEKNIKYAVSPKFIELSSSVNNLVELAVEIWRIEQRITKLLSHLSDNQKKGLDNSIQKFKRYLEKYDIEIIDYTNQKYNEGLNLDILSVEKDKSISEPVVKETVEPTIMCKGQVVRKAKIILLSK